MTTYQANHLASTTRAEVTTLLDRAIKKLEAIMLESVRSDVPLLQDASRHILEAGGKRVRPRVLLLSYLAAGGQDTDYAIPPAAAVELIHTASIVHDDINDQGVMRRGRPSINSQWGRTFALLTGDFIFARVYELMVPYADLNLILSRAATALVEGETLQAVAVKEGRYTLENYHKIISLKTAELFKAAALMGGRLAEASEGTAQALADYGYNIGLAFQVVDDLLDLVSDQEKLGKTAGIDLQQGRGIAAALAAAGGLEAAVERGYERAVELAERAIAALDVLPASAVRDELIALAELIVKRKN